MKKNVPGKIADSLVLSGAVPAEDKALYEFGIRQGILLVINIATAVLIGMIMGMVWQTIVFLIAYTPVRSYAGGYHAGTQLICYLLSIPMILAVLLGVRFIPWNGYVFSILIVCAGIAVFLLAPVEDRNKPLDQLERAVYGKKARMISVILIAASISLWLTGAVQSALSVAMALGAITVMLVLGSIKNRNLMKEEKA